MQSRQRGTIPPKVRWQVFARDGFRCRYCGARGGEAVLVIDHRIPVSNGGADHIRNLITACEECNQGKSDAAVPTFGDLALTHDAALAVAYWLREEWLALVPAADPAHMPRVGTFIRIAADCDSYAVAVEVLRDIAEVYHRDRRAVGAWVETTPYSGTVDNTLAGYASWWGAQDGRDEGESDDDFKARFWEDVPF